MMKSESLVFIWGLVLIEKMLLQGQYKELWKPGNWKQDFSLETWFDYEAS